MSIEKPHTFITEPTTILRFVIRDGERILQQRVDWMSLDRTQSGSNWQDVPTEEEK